MEYNYCLRTWALGKQPEMAIDESRYTALRVASRAQRLFLSIEDKLDLVLANYREFEAELLAIALRNMIHRQHDWTQGSEDRLLVNRRLANLLSTTRLYVDQATHEINAAAAIQPEMGSVTPRVYLSREYDRSLGFRVMEALRNHVQHRSIPVAHLVFSTELENDREDPLWLFRVSIGLDMMALRDDSEFKPSVLGELEAMDEKVVDLVLFVRQHVEGLARAHQAMREAMKPAVMAADEVVDAAVADWCGEGNSTLGLAAVERRSDRTAVDHVFLGTSVKERRIELAKRNATFDNLSRRFVTSARPRANYEAWPPPPSQQAPGTGDGAA